MSMSLDERTLAIFDEYQSGRLSRRQFVQRLVGLGFASSTIALFLAACGGAAATPTTEPQASTAPSAAPAASSTAPSSAQVGKDPGVLVSPDPNPKRGGTLRIVFGVTTSNYDMQQGAESPVLCNFYSQ